jgi:hypothetical protein
MPEIDLPPSKYRWRRPLSLPLAWAFVGLGAGMLFWIYQTRSGSMAEWLLTILVSFAIGLLVAGIMRNID